MNEVATSAPGKLIVLGEYAVLEGAPALVAAIGRRARVRMVESLDDHIEIHAPALDVLGARARIDAHGLLRWPDASTSARLALFGHVWRALAREALAPAPGRGLRIELDTAEFFAAGGQGKLGLGSSAALTVALAAALAIGAAQADRLAARDAWLQRLIDLHGDWQGGRGSGADVAASLHGGLISYRRGNGQPLVAARTWPPAGAQCLFVWSGQSVSTHGFLERLATWRAARPALFAARMGDLCALAQTTDAALHAGAGAFVSLIADYARALGELARASGLQIFSPAQEHAALLAVREGAAYKPCGAGGDFGMVVADEPGRLERVRRSIIADGLQPVALAVDPRGLQFDESFTQSGRPPIAAANGVHGLP